MLLLDELIYKSFDLKKTLHDFGGLVTFLGSVAMN